MSPRRKRLGSTIPSFDYLSHAEKELFPDRPYHFLTQDQREKTYEYAKDIIFQKTGVRIP